MDVEAKFIKSLRNAATERQAHDFVLLDRRFQKPPADAKRRILELLGARGSFSHQSFDLVMTHEPSDPITVDNVDAMIDAITLIEVKSTKKSIRDRALNGFFFGSSATQYELAEVLSSRILWAFVVLNDDNDYGHPFFVLLTTAQVAAKTRTKRLQYQVNFETGMSATDELGPLPDPDHVTTFGL